MGATLPEKHKKTYFLCTLWGGGGGGQRRCLREDGTRTSLPQVLSLHGNSPAHKCARGSHVSSVCSLCTPWLPCVCVPHGCPVCHRVQAETEKSSFKASLTSPEELDDDRIIRFRVQSRYKVRSEGETVRYMDQVLLSPEWDESQFLHVSSNSMPDSASSHEVRATGCSGVEGGEGLSLDLERKCRRPTPCGRLGRGGGGP